MKLLIVVDKLLTGFDAPPATYLYIDKPMRDHGLFQAICRVNRLDSEDKEYGFVVDYRDLFKSLRQSIRDYTGGAFDGYDEDDVKDLLKDRLRHGKEGLEDAREKIKELSEPVEPPHDTAAYIRYFCQGESSERKRLALYRLTASFVRAYANIAGEMIEAGYSEEESNTIRDEVSHYENARQEVKLASGDYIDLKTYEPAMRHILDSYIEAENSEKLSEFDDLSLVDMLVRSGEDALYALPEGIRGSPEATAETIENNIRSVIVVNRAINPMYYANIFSLLDLLIQQRRDQAIDYKEYLEQVVELAKRATGQGSEYPPSIGSSALRALYDNLPDDESLARVGDSRSPYSADEAVGHREKMAFALDEAIRGSARDDWRGNVFKERAVHNAIKSALEGPEQLIDEIFEIVKAQSEY